jgi:hypothetical protein
MDTVDKRYILLGLFGAIIAVRLLPKLRSGLREVFDGKWLEDAGDLVFEGFEAVTSKQPPQTTAQPSATELRLQEQKAMRVATTGNEEQLERERRAALTASDREYKKMDVAVTKPPVTSIPIEPIRPKEGVDSIERHLADRMTCSKSCCGAQWPVPHMQDTYRKAGTCAKNYIPSGMSCGNGDEGTGCVCMTKESSEFMDSRGGNA